MKPIISVKKDTDNSNDVDNGYNFEDFEILPSPKQKTHGIKTSIPSTWSVDAFSDVDSEEKKYDFDTSSDTQSVIQYDPLDDICKRHNISTPYKLCNYDKTIIKTIHTNLVKVVRTIALGSGNKIDDYIHTKGWSYGSLMQREFNTLTYIKHQNNPVKWRLEDVYRRRHANPALVYKEEIYKTYPSLQNNFNLINLIKRIPILKKERVGNCNDKSNLFAYYLWQSILPGITRIEVVGYRGIFDHVFVILNRDIDSDLNDPERWGERCWIVDPWWGSEGTAYASCHYKDKSMESLRYCMNQKAYLESLGLTFDYSAEDMRVAFSNLKSQPGSIIDLESYVDIDTKRTPYEPKPHERSYDEYYDFTPFRTEGYTKVLELKKEQKPQYRLVMRELLDRTKNDRRLDPSASTTTHYQKRRTSK